MQTGLEKNLFGNHPVSLSSAESHSPLPGFSSDAGGENIATSSSVAKDEAGAGSTILQVTDIVEIEGPSSAGNFIKSTSPVGVRGVFCYLLN